MRRRYLAPFLASGLVLTLALGISPAIGAAAVTKAQAREAYELNCAGCHGETGLGDGPITMTEQWQDIEAADPARKPPNFKRDWFRYGDSPAEISRTIVNGSRNTAMIGFPDAYSPAMVRALAEVVISLRQPMSNAVIRRKHPERIPRLAPAQPYHR